jgi:magnesium-transporting ATPase (P-type)
VPGWKRFIGQYRTYMQLILVGAAIVSLAIKEWSTAALLILITIIDAVVGLRHQGKAESAMNALQAMVKASASGTEVAKNAGRMILTDDDFATIVHAVEEGRKLYDNLTKYVRFVLISLVAFVLTFLGATLLNIAAGQPFTPPQVLWIHFFY